MQIFTVSSEIRKKQINALCGQNVEILNDNPRDI
jgi:hypothetical protein